MAHPAYKLIIPKLVVPGSINLSWYIKNCCSFYTAALLTSIRNQIIPFIVFKSIILHITLFFSNSPDHHVSPLSMIVFFSIGNPGPLSRHSVGHFVMKHLVDGLGAKQLTKKGKYSATTIDNVMLAKSNTYMNESAELLRQLLTRERLGNSIIFIVYDDFDIDIPKVRVRDFKAKNESHNGIKSVWKLLQGNQHQCYKLGVGIGPKPSGANKDAMASFVLADFTPGEKEHLSDSMDRVFTYVHEILQCDGDIGDVNKLNARVTKSVGAAD